MNKLITAFIVMLVQQAVSAQRSIDGLVQAEKDFAAYSVSHGVRAAFLNFADSFGVIFENGEPVKAIEAWTKRGDPPIKLDWWPEYAEISASGEFGYTTGPWTLSLRDTIRNRGYYNTVWHFNEQGEWKFIVDLGVNLSSVGCDFAALTKVVSKNGSKDNGTTTTLKQADDNFLSAYKQSGKTAYNNFLSPDARLYRNNQCVASDAEQRPGVLDSVPPGIGYKIYGLSIASAGDLGCTYGTAYINNKEEGYLRIWRNEKDGWRIALEVFRY